MMRLFDKALTGSRNTASGLSDRAGSGRASSRHGLSGAAAAARNAEITAVAVLIMVLTMAGLAAAGITDGTVYAEHKRFTEQCEYDGYHINSDFSSDKFASTIKNMEPGDDLTYRIEYKNKSDKTTLWYMKNDVLETLEENKKQAENGGYTYKLKNESPDGSIQVYFDNSEVGGEKVVDKLEGLKQATNATKNYFFIQELKPGESGATHLYVLFDGETEVNDYMDTQGALLVKYAVQDLGETSGKPGSDPIDDPDDPRYDPTGDHDDDEDDGHSGKKKHKDPTITRGISTGDMNRIMYYVTLFSAAAVLLILAVIIWLRSIKKEQLEEAAAGEHAREGSQNVLAGEAVKNSDMAEAGATDGGAQDVLAGEAVKNSDMAEAGRKAGESHE